MSRPGYGEPGLTPEQRLRARELFEAALERAPADVPRWLDSSAADDPAVREEVRSLLEHHSRAGAFLTQPLVEAAPHLLDDEPSLAPGTTIGAYTIVREIGRGGMGRVYLASDARLGRPVALKAVAPHLAADPRHRDRLRREARAAALLTHPGICTVYALEEADGEIYIATEFVDGHTLRDEIAQGRRPSAETIVSTGRELASALAGAHAKGITHRDLKPENVMRTPDGRIKILDFGLARIDAPGAMAGGPLTASGAGAVAGTPAYMSPEQIDGRPVGPAADVFAFGLLMHEWICGTHPFHAATALATLARILESTPEPLDGKAGVPPWLARVIARCLEKEPAKRYASGPDLLAAFEHPAVAGSTPRRTIWWQIHQVAAIVLYVAASAHAWQIKEAWLRGPITLWIFVLIGVAASIGGIIRGHLIFTDEVNRANLAGELRRTAHVRLAVDLTIAALLAIDALLLAPQWPLSAVLTVSLATGIALAALLMEPATTAAVFGKHPLP